MIRYFKPAEIEDFEVLTTLLDPDDFLSDMVELGELDEVSNNYSYDCSLLCHNGVAWALRKLSGTLFFFVAKVMYGHCGLGEHSWLKVGDYYIDLTLAQFVRDAPRLAITLVKDAEDCGYKPSLERTTMEWVTSQMDEGYNPPLGETTAERAARQMEGINTCQLKTEGST